MRGQRTLSGQHKLRGEQKRRTGVLCLLVTMTDRIGGAPRTVAVPLLTVTVLGGCSEEKPRISERRCANLPIHGH
jgi:hypothetical protein